MARTWTYIVTLPLTWLACGAAAAQTPRPPAVEVEILAGGVATGSLDFDGAELRSGMAGVRVSAPLSNRFAIEGDVVAGPGGQTCCFRRVEGFYTVQVRQRLTGAPGPGFFLTYGGAGYFAREHYPGLRRTIVEAPFIAVVGVGIDRSLARHVRVRADVQGLTVLHLPLGVRGSVGVAFDLGRR